MEYNLQYLKSLIDNKVEENLNLEYKSALALGKQDGKKTEISKDISAFANSDGGVIIYGISEDDLLPHIPKELDPIKRHDYSKEWLEQVINDNIQPRIENLKIYPISLSDEVVVYVVCIGKSDTAHQANDKRYFKRFNFQSVPMYDYEIRDILNRQKHPKLDLKFVVANESNLVIFVKNIGAVFASYINVNIRLPRKIVVGAQYHKILSNNMVEISAKNTMRDMVDNYSPIAKYGPSRYEPILPQTSYELITITLRDFPFDYEHVIEWDIFCDNASPIHGSARMSELLNQ